MTTNASKPRSQRGLDLATAKHQLFRRIDENTWIVPSATCSHHVYLVDVSRLTCTCTDAGGAICKHLWAVLHLDNEIAPLDGTHLNPPSVTDAEETSVDDEGVS